MLIHQDIWFWQRIVTPHMAGLAVALARRGHEVVYVAEQLMTTDRALQGWAPSDLGGARLELISSAIAVQTLVKAVPENSIHICQGIRANGLVGVAQQALAARGTRQWVVMETVDDTGWRGLLKRFEYRRLFLQWRSRIEGVLATGYRTPAWVVAQGMPESQVYPFAYFLSEQQRVSTIRPETIDNRFRIVFVGQFIERKRLEWLITAMARLSLQNIQLVVIGSGPLEQQWRTMADALLPGRVEWIGRLPMEQVWGQMVKADCLVLPSRHDGWGAVVSESLMVGTPVICSDACGAASVVLASGIGGVFRADDIDALYGKLHLTIEKGRLPQVEKWSLANWAQCLGTQAGAEYLLRIFDHHENPLVEVRPPWETAKPSLYARID